MAAHELEKEVFLEDVKPAPITYTFDFNERDAPILEEMKQYEREAEYARQSYISLDPLAFWNSRAA